jgi:hypothetical protein
MLNARTLTLAVTALGLAASAFAQAPTPPVSQPAPPLPLGPTRERGVSVTPSYEGWYQNADGTYSLLVGYFNRNKGEALDIPVGPNNKIEPGPIDQGQPTHFQIGRQWGVFVIKVPKDFGKKMLTWSITANGETQSIPFGITNGYTIEPFQEAGMGNKPPEFTFESGKVFAAHDGVGHADRHGQSAGRHQLQGRRPQGNQEGLGAHEPARRRRGGHRLLPQTSRARHGEVRTGAGGDEDAGRSGLDDCDVQPAGRVPAARAGQRRIGRGRCWVPVLLDEYLRESHRQVTTGAR